MIDEIGFTITFHTPFRVGTTSGRDGVDITVDREEPLGADHLKGLMRYAAQHVLDLPAEVFGAVFGSPGTPSPWAWTAAAAPGGNWGELGAGHRIEIDEVTHAVREDHLVLGEYLHPTRAEFTVSRHRYLEPADVETHTVILRCAGAAVHGLGGWRRRGLGWVGITPAFPVTADDVRILRDLTGAADGHART
ncbi:hypothetical protein [Millisia brevis]|uniref:hypothetical protein n=1 Tax=Millisia brevis TaxID=264148 RepID=UPI00082B248D|nr:hypothetical protein [Millisia brevis]